MNSDERKELQGRLERATASRGPADEPLDPEVAALRAGWLALGELLEAAQPQSAPRVQRLPLPPASRRHRRLSLAMAALALSAVAALAVSWHAWGTKPAAVSPAPTVEIARNNAVPATSPVPKAPAVSRDTELAWDNSLDQEIERAGRAIQQAQQDQLASTAVSGRVQYQLENLKKNVDSDPL